MTKLKLNNAKGVVLIVLFLGWVFTSEAQNKGQNGNAAGIDSSKIDLNLKSAIDYALKNQLTLKNAQLNEDIAREKIGEIASAGLPQINAAASVSSSDPLRRMFFDPNNRAIAAFLPPGPPISAKVVAIPNFFQLANTGDAGINITQLLFSNSYLIGLKAANAYKDFSVLQTEQARLQVIEDISKMYYLVLINEERLVLLDRNVLRLDSILKQTKALYKNGLVENLDVERVQVAFNNLKTTQQNAIYGQYLCKLGLKLQMGLPLGTDIHLSDKIADYTVEPPVESTAKGGNYNARIEYALLASAKKLQTLDLKLKQSSVLPTLAAFGNLGEFSQSTKFDYFTAQNSWYNYGMFGFSLNLPIFDGFGNQHRIKQARLNLAITENNIKNAERGIDAQVENAAVALKNNILSLSNEKENIELAQSVAKATKQKFAQGMGSSLEVTTAETGLLEAQTNYFTTLYNALLAKVDYQKATGSLNNRK